MWFLEWILSLLTYPVTWFWTLYEKYKESRCIWKIVALFTVSLSGLALFVFTFLWLIMWLITCHIELVITFGLIIWLYAYIKSKMDNKLQKENDCSQEIKELEEQAVNTYPTIRNIMYQTLKGTAENIGGIIPRLLAEIEVIERHYIISNNICFYQFRLEKADIRMRYQQEELQEFERILQNSISRKIQAGEFPTLGVEKFLDSYGNVYDAVYVDVIEDMDTCFIIQLVLYSPTYADYLRQRKINQQGASNAVSVPDASWNSKQ